MVHDSVFVEQWTEYSIGIIVFLLRIYARLATVGWRKFQKDDVLILISIGLWTGVNVSVYILNSNLSFSSAPGNLIMDDATYTSFKRGTHAVMSSWTTYTTLIWSLKACWLIIFSTLTLGLRQQAFVKIFAYIIALCYVGTITMILIHCIPAGINWHVEQLSNGVFRVVHGPLYVRWTVANYIVVASMNCGTDLLLLSIPLPLLFRLKASIRRKLVLAILLCSGIFVIIAALLRCIESLGAIGNIYNSTIWGIREVFVGICAVCAPGIRPLFVKKRQMSATDPGSFDSKQQNSAPSDSRSARDIDFEKIDITQTRETARSRDTLESIHNAPDVELHTDNKRPFTTKSRSLSSYSYQSESSRLPFYRRMPLSVIHSESESAMSASSIRPSVLDRASLHPPPNVLTVSVVEPLEVYVCNGAGLQQDIEKKLQHIYRREEIDLEKG